MKAAFRSLLILLLVVSMLFIVSCKQKNPDTNPDDNPPAPPQDDTPAEPTKPTDTRPPETGDYIYRNGFCDYVVLMPQDATSYEIAARDEFLTLFSEATSYTMTVVTDNETVPEGKYYISIGDTKALRESGISATEAELGYSGYKIVNLNKNIYISGDVDRNCPGTLYGVYGLLADCFNYKAYAADCYRLDKSHKVALRAWNTTEVPDFNMRSLGYLDLNQDSQYANRMRLQQFNGSMTSNEWVTNGHSMCESLLNPNAYIDQHPEWYYLVAGSYTLCMTNSEIVEAMANRVKTELEKNTVARYMMLGQSDTSASCQCKNCQKRAEELGGSYSAVQLEFINKVADIVTPWLNETQPGRDMTFYTFAYWWSLNPPGVNAEGKRYMYARDNVGIMFAPLNMDYRYPVESTKNAQYDAALNGWAEVTKHLTVYYYPISFHNYLLPFNDFGSLTANIRQLKEMDCEYFFTQGPHNESRGAAMQDLKIFVQAQLLWDSTQNLEQLVKEFNTYYFGAAADAMQEYYDITRNWYEADINGALENTGLCGVSWGNEDAYPKDFVEYMTSCLDAAQSAIEAYQTTDPTLYDAIYWRIEKERLTVTYLNLLNYTSYYSSEEVYQMALHFKETAEHFNITSYKEGGSITVFLQPYLN